MLCRSVLWIAVKWQIVSRFAATPLWHVLDGPRHQCLRAGGGRGRQWLVDWRSWIVSRASHAHTSVSICQHAQYAHTRRNISFSTWLAPSNHEHVLRPVKPIKPISLLTAKRPKVTYTTAGRAGNFNNTIDTRGTPHLPATAQGFIEIGRGDNIWKRIQQNTIIQCISQKQTFRKLG